MLLRTQVAMEDGCQVYMVQCTCSHCQSLSGPRKMLTMTMYVYMYMYTYNMYMYVYFVM